MVYGNHLFTDIEASRRAAIKDRGKSKIVFPRTQQDKALDIMKKCFDIKKRLTTGDLISHKYLSGEASSLFGKLFR